MKFDVKSLAKKSNSREREREREREKGLSSGFHNSLFFRFLFFFSSKISIWFKSGAFAFVSEVTLQAPLQNEAAGIKPGTDRINILRL